MSRRFFNRQYVGSIGVLGSWLGRCCRHFVIVACLDVQAFLLTGRECDFGQKVVHVKVSDTRRHVDGCWPKGENALRGNKRLAACCR